jgi:hypothetical protein
MIILSYSGKPIAEMTRDELIEALEETAKRLNREMDRVHVLEIAMTELIPKKSLLQRIFG